MSIVSDQSYLKLVELFPIGNVKNSQRLSLIFPPGHPQIVTFCILGQNFHQRLYYKYNKTLFKITNGPILYTFFGFHQG